MKKISKTEIKEAVVTALVPVLLKLELAKPSRKIRKSISRISKQIKLDWKKQSRKAQKSGKYLRNGKPNDKAEAAAA